MALNNEDVNDLIDKKQEWKNKCMQRRSTHRISFSASLPEDVCGVFAGSLCAVKYSDDPFTDIRDSILEMIREVKICDWSDVEELAYCYIALNSPELHRIIQDAFLSLSCYFKPFSHV